MGLENKTEEEIIIGLVPRGPNLYKEYEKDPLFPYRNCVGEWVTITTTNNIKGSGFFKTIEGCHAVLNPYLGNGEGEEEDKLDAELIKQDCKIYLGDMPIIEKTTKKVLEKKCRIVNKSRVNPIEVEAISHKKN